MSLDRTPSNNRMEPCKAKHGYRQQGFTLLEVLVAIVVISLGLLGLAGLQVVSLNNNQTAYYRSIATQQAYDMADRVRANLAGVKANEYNNLDNSIPTDPDCVTNACTPAQMADADHAQWNINNQRLLPGGFGTVCSAALPCPLLPAPAPANNDVGPDGAYRIAVAWTERTAAGNITQYFVTWVTP